MSSLSPGLVRRIGLATAVESLAGALAIASDTDITLQPYAFFPMIHESSPAFDPDIRIRGGPDLADPDQPQLRFVNAGGNARTYDVDYRYVAP